MPERKPAPAVRLKGELPGGNRNGLAATAEHFLAGREHVLFVGKLGRKGLETDDDKQATVPILRIVAAAVPSNPDVQGYLSELLTDTLAEQFGSQPAIPGAEASPAGRGEYERALAAWQSETGLSDADVQAQWRDYFGAAVVPGPLGAELQHLVEFVLERCGGLR